ncbi:hypothetical protein WA158_000461 [Blastocystis sp. Blastoise]
MALSTSVRKQAEEIISNDYVEDEEDSFENVDKLQQFGVNATDIKKLKEAGLYTIGLVMKTPVKDLLAVKGLSEAKVEKILQVCKQVGGLFYTGREVMHLREKVIKITTGSKELDTLLGGGIETMSITEVFGEFRTGKTQLAHTLCVTTQLPSEMHGANGKVTRPQRIIEIANRYGLNGEDVLDNILLARAYTHEQQMDIITAAAAKIVEDEAPYHLLIVDSVTALFRVDYSGRGELSERQQKLNRHMSALKKHIHSFYNYNNLYNKFNIAVLIVNQVTADPGAASMFVKDTKKPIGGNIIAHASTTRLYLRKGKGEQRICKIYDSPDRPESEATFAIGTLGIVDAED